jgi:TPR repeat protein
VLTPKDIPQAVVYARKGADQGDAQAEVVLGLCYEAGSGVDRSDAQALEWFKKAGAGSDPNGLMELASVYLHGRVGAPVDVARAIELYRKPADFGIPPAQTALGDIYRHGAAGLAADPAQARTWPRPPTPTRAPPTISA